MAKKTGYSADTKKHLLLGAGAYFKNFEVGTDTYETSKNKLIGATQGGGEFKAAPTIRQIAVDGIAGKAADLATLDDWNVTLSAKFIEVTEDVLKQALAVSSIDTTTDANYDIITGNDQLKSEHYTGNITFIGTISGSDKPIIIQVFNALCTSGLTVGFEDNNEGTVQVVWEGTYSVANPDAPFKIYYPKMA